MKKERSGTDIGDGDDLVVMHAFTCHGVKINTKRKKSIFFLTEHLRSLKYLFLTFNWMNRVNLWHNVSGVSVFVIVVVYELRFVVARGIWDLRNYTR